MIGSIFQNWLPFLRPWRCIGVVDSADEVPQRLPRKAAVLIASGDRLKWIAFDCPCGRDHRILLNLDASRRPSWRFGASDGRISLHPSIDAYVGGRRCHYHIRDGRVIWAKDSDR